LLGTAQQLFGHCQAQKEEIQRLFQQKLDEVVPGGRATALESLFQPEI
jgi:H3 lysine-79-specific histone-lysine N-methyltransferase